MKFSSSMRDNILPGFTLISNGLVLLKNRVFKGIGYPKSSNFPIMLYYA